MFTFRDWRAHTWVSCFYLRSGWSNYDNRLRITQSNLLEGVPRAKNGRIIHARFHISPNITRSSIILLLSFRTTLDSALCVYHSESVTNNGEELSIIATTIALRRKGNRLNNPFDLILQHGISTLTTPSLSSVFEKMLLYPRENKGAFSWKIVEIQTSLKNIDKFFKSTIILENNDSGV